METKIKTRTQQVLRVMLIVSWVAFIALIIEAGAILVSYGISCVNPEAARNFYRGLDLYNLNQFSFGQYTLFVFFMAALPALKAFISYLIIKTLSSVNLKNPFTMEVAMKLQRTSYVMLGAWGVTVLAYAQASWLQQATGVKYAVEDLSGHLFVAGLVFIISQVFKRGVEIQSENELTV